MAVYFSCTRSDSPPPARIIVLSSQQDQLTGRVMAVAVLRNKTQQLSPWSPFNWSYRSVCSLCVSYSLSPRGKVAMGETTRETRATVCVEAGYASGDGVGGVVFTCVSIDVLLVVSDNYLDLTVCSKRLASLCLVACTIIRKLPFYFPTFNIVVYSKYSNCWKIIFWLFFLEIFTQKIIIIIWFRGFYKLYLYMHLPIHIFIAQK